MAQQADFTLYDGASTPVAHVFKSDGMENSVGAVTARWKEQISTVPDYAQCRFTQVRRKPKNGVSELVTRVEVPVMEAVSGNNTSGYTAPPKVAYVDRVEFRQFSHSRSTETTKRIATQLLLAALLDSHTSNTPVTSGIVMDLHQRLLIVS